MFSSTSFPRQSWLLLSLDFVKTTGGIYYESVYFINAEGQEKGRRISWTEKVLCSGGSPPFTPPRVSPACPPAAGKGFRLYDFIPLQTETAADTGTAFWHRFQYGKVILLIKLAGNLSFPPNQVFYEKNVMSWNYNGDLKKKKSWLAFPRSWRKLTVKVLDGVCRGS